MSLKGIKGYDDDDDDDDDEKDYEKGSTMCRKSQFSPNILRALVYVSNAISTIKSGRDEGVINCTLRQIDTWIKSRSMSCMEPRSMHVRHETCIKIFEENRLEEDMKMDIKQLRGKTRELDSLLEVATETSRR